MENGKAKTGFLVQEFTSGDVCARLWGNRIRANMCCFRLSLKQVGSYRGKPEYSYSFSPSNLDDLMLVILQAKNWFRNPVLVTDAIEQVDRWYDQYHLPS